MDKKDRIFGEPSADNINEPCIACRKERASVLNGYCPQCFKQSYSRMSDKVYIKD